MTQQSRKNGSGQTFGLVVTNLIKLAGAVIAVSEAFQAQPDSRVLATAALMIAGAQGVENFLKGVFGK